MRFEYPKYAKNLPKNTKGGGIQLISCKEEGNFVSFAVDTAGLNPNDYKGILKFKIKFENEENDRLVNNTLKLAGVTKAVEGEDGITNVLAEDIKSGALRIKGTENFFREDEEANNLVRFKLKAKCGVDQSQELSLNSDSPCIETYTGVSNVGAQKGNTYQIIDTDNCYSKLYWGTDETEDDNTLIFEIPVELPELIDQSYITSVEASVAYINQQYIVNKINSELTVVLDDKNQCKGIEYELDTENSTAKVTMAYNDNILENTIIPDYVVDTEGKKYAVTSIEDAILKSDKQYNNIFAQCMKLKTLEIGNNVKRIGMGSFYACRNLSAVTIPNSVEIIGKEAFKGCKNLSAVTIPDSVTSIGVGAFAGCQSIESVTIPNSVTSMGSYAFYQCSGLTSVIIGSGVKSIGAFTFAWCSGLSEVIIPDNVTSIGKGAFWNCSGLNSVTIGSGVTSIDDCVFQDCSSLSKVIINSKNLNSVGANAFSKKLDDDSFVVLPQAVEFHVPADKINDYRNVITNGATNNGIWPTNWKIIAISESE